MAEMLEFSFRISWALRMSMALARHSRMSLAGTYGFRLTSLPE